MEHEILMIFGNNKKKQYIATNITVLLKTAFVLQGHIVFLHTAIWAILFLLSV